MRRPFIAANWKMHKTCQQADRFLNDFLPRISDIKDVDVAISPPYTALSTVSKKIETNSVLLCAQNMHYKKEGAFTGEVSPLMIKEVGCEYVIVGHSERREFFCESDQIVNEKIRIALENGLHPIVCVGETQQQREKGRTKNVLTKQTRIGLKDLDRQQAKKITVAYEPIWAIGTGESASPSDARDGCSFVRSQLEKLFGNEVSETIRIQYGGSIKPHNTVELLNQEDIDGGLVGSASLKPDSFSKIIQKTSQLS